MPPPQVRSSYAPGMLPDDGRGAVPGMACQLGNLLASANATLQATTAESHGGNYEPGSPGSPPLSSGSAVATPKTGYQL